MKRDESGCDGEVELCVGAPTNLTYKSVESTLVGLQFGLRLSGPEVQTSQVGLYHAEDKHFLP